MGFEVEVRNVDGAVTALGAAGPFTLVVDRPAEARPLLPRTETWTWGRVG